MIDRASLKKHLPGVVGAAVLLLALFEAGAAVLAPLRSPTDEHWIAAATKLRAQFRSGDLIVAAPSWADPVMRLHLGDLMSLDMAARLDDATYARVWELSQRGASTPESAGSLALDEAYGPLRLRRWERTAAQTTFNFVNEWQQARVLRQSPSATVPCSLQHRPRMTVAKKPGTTNRALRFSSLCPSSASASIAAFTSCRAVSHRWGSSRWGRGPARETLPGTSRPRETLTGAKSATPLCQA